MTNSFPEKTLKKTARFFGDEALTGVSLPT